MKTVYSLYKCTFW